MALLYDCHSLFGRADSLDLVGVFVVAVYNGNDDVNYLVCTARHAETINLHTIRWVDSLWMMDKNTAG